jgi:hypothetical protein
MTGGLGMRSLPYDAYEQQAYARDFFITPGPHDADQPYTRTGLSPFDIPVRVNVEVTSADRCLFRFGYSNDEPPEATSKTIPSNTALSALLGKNTGKVLEFRIVNALQVLSSGPIDFDDSVAVTWSANLPTHARKTCMRNTHVVRAILRSMPEKFRLEIVELLRSITAETKDEPWK